MASEARRSRVACPRQLRLPRRCTPRNDMGENRLWIAKASMQRTDNLVCAAVVLEDQLIVKTVMHHFEWEEMS
ncbi:hypothetical protein DQ400_18830 [Vreelandella sulfidaeris]|uniref:Uncharacterized protein n=1 Tax=Vreelandella sulfidaeris TaxID=115553 RepID=A0A365TIE0_9GAMM|nr:hypothetical protein DQ400_18830 [Halomonas sulfidaeris]